MQVEDGLAAMVPDDSVLAHGQRSGDPIMSLGLTFNRLDDDQPSLTDQVILAFGFPDLSVPRRPSDGRPDQVATAG